MMRNIVPGNVALLYRILIPVAMFDILDDTIELIDIKITDSNV